MSDNTKLPSQMSVQEFREYLKNPEKYRLKHKTGFDLMSPNESLTYMNKLEDKAQKIMHMVNIHQAPHAPTKIKLPEPEAKGISDIRMMLVLSKLEWIAEYRFHKKRRWRFDFAIPSLKIGIEYEGLNSNQSGHTTLLGYTKDCEKYNAAALEGWTVLRYTTRNYKKFSEDLNTMLDRKTKTNK